MTVFNHTNIFIKAMVCLELEGHMHGRETFHRMASRLDQVQSPSPLLRVTLVLCLPAP